MKRVKINAYQAGLVFREGAYRRFLAEGSYWFWRGEAVEVYEMTKPFMPPVELNILLRDEALADRLEVITVKDNEIILQYEDGLLKKVLTAGRYAFWKGVMDYRFLYADTSQLMIDAAIDPVLLHQPLLMPYVRSISVESYEKALLFEDGRYTRLLDSGVYRWWKNSITLQVVRVDMRRQQLEINGQEILTRDKAALRINAWAQYQIADIEKAVLQNKEYVNQLYVALQLALREYVAGYGFDELLEKKEGISAFVLETVQDKAAALGIMLNGFGIRDIILPGDVKEIMNQVLVAEKKAQANIIMRREETASTRSLLNTARLMEENAMLWRLKEMEYIEKIADRVNSISVTGNGMLVEQLKQLFIAQK